MLATDSETVLNTLVSAEGTHSFIIHYLETVYLDSLFEPFDNIEITATTVLRGTSENNFQHC
jgi:hypothetical protein